MPEQCRQRVIPEYRSASDTYYGYIRRGETNLVLHAGWENTRAAPFDLGATELRCRTFCHFGCSSQLHFWKIVRKPGYRGWERPEPPVDRFAYFTTHTSYPTSYWWLYYLLKCPYENGDMHLWRTHEYAKRMANRKLARLNQGFQIY
jgi:hypothetical protein